MTASLLVYPSGPADPMAGLGKPRNSPLRI